MKTTDAIPLREASMKPNEMSKTKEHFHNEIEAGQRTASRKEHPILFSTPMVQAILEGRKTQTRRTRGLELINKNPDDWQFEWADFSLDKPWRFTQKSTINEESLQRRTFNQEAIKGPYGQPGDRLWVRETFAKNVTSDIQTNPINIYKADYPDSIEDLTKYIKEHGYSWKPSIHMPKAAARIWLEIEEVKVERLQDISEEDAKAEGILHYTKSLQNSGKYNPDSRLMAYPVTAFSRLWQKINGPKSWEANPWVWVIKFKVLSTSGKPINQ